MPSALETRQAMFWAATAAQFAGEPSVTTKRIVAALLRTESIREFCSRARIDSAVVVDTIEDPQTLSVEEAERRARSELAERGIAVGSPEHLAGFQPRPLEPAARDVIDGVIRRLGSIGLPPLALLLDFLRADPVLAARLAPHGLDAETIAAAL